MNAIETQNLTKTFGSQKVLDAVSFALPQGAFLSIFGPNGAGKTTLLRVLSTLIKPSSGTFFIEGIDGVKETEQVRSCLGIISHKSMLYPDLSAEENLVLFAKLYNVENPVLKARSLLDAVGLTLRRDERVKYFSKGMMQRVAIARALIHDPAIVLLDEPYSGLDPRAAEIFDSLIASTRDKHTFIMVSHDLSKGLAVASHAMVLDKGRIAYFEEADAGKKKELKELYEMTLEPVSRKQVY